MLDIRWMRENKEICQKGLHKKGVAIDVDQLMEHDSRLREGLTELERMRREMNERAKEVGLLKRQGKDIEQKMAGQKELSEQISAKEEIVREIRTEQENMLIMIPNIPHESVPEGSSDNENVEIKNWGQIRDFAFDPVPHWDLGENLDIIDLKRASKITGSGFICFKGQGALLERALINFMLDVHTQEHGYTEIWPPILVNRASMTGTGQLPKMQDDMYRIEGEDLFLVPTAEVPLTNLYAGEVFEENQLPHAVTAYTPCFRKEAGAYGKDTRGIIRVHQFDKVELVRFVHPKQSYEELEKLLVQAENILKKLGLAYRIRLLCAGDMSFAAAKCYDIEAWAPAQKKFLEVSSCSNFEDFQSRRANIRFKDGSGKKAYIHTLNGSGVALARTVIALMESYQREDGTIDVPEVLWPYTRGLKRLEQKIS
ncbi:MAG: serine--tRNA ligase [Chlamydiota bacterium]|nr:serine--tRNA ligase [Chlamydiota bacterium]